MSDDAYEVAKSGGRHGGFYQNNQALPSGMLQRGVARMEKTIELHEAWIANPYLKVSRTADKRQIDALVTRKWPGDIARIREEMAILKGILSARGEG